MAQCRMRECEVETGIVTGVEVASERSTASTASCTPKLCISNICRISSVQISCTKLALSR